VVVATIQMRTLKTEVEKGSMRTAFGHGLLDPKAKDNSIIQVAVYAARGQKGMRLIFLKLDGDTVWQHKRA